MLETCPSPEFMHLTHDFRQISLYPLYLEPGIHLRASTGLFLTLHSENKSAKMGQHVIGINNQQSLSLLRDSSRLYSGWWQANSATNTLNKQSLLNCTIAWRTSFVVFQNIMLEEAWLYRQLCEALKEWTPRRWKSRSTQVYTGNKRQLVPSFIASWKNQIHWNRIYLLQVPIHFHSMISEPTQELNGSTVLLPKWTANTTCPWHIFLTTSRNKTAATTKTIYSATAFSQRVLRKSRWQKQVTYSSWAQILY